MLSARSSTSGVVTSALDEDDDEYDDDAEDEQLVDVQLLERLVSCSFLEKLSRLLDLLRRRVILLMKQLGRLMFNPFENRLAFCGLSCCSGRSDLVPPLELFLERLLRLADLLR